MKHLICLSLFVLGACDGTPQNNNDGNPANPDAVGSSDAAPTVDSAPSSGCGKPATAGLVNRTISIGGVDRNFAIRIPANYDPAVLHPVVCALHGAGSTGGAALGSPLTIRSVPAIMVGPTAKGTYWGDPSDTQLVDAINALLPTELCVDTARTFVYGYSSGGFMASTLACTRGNVFKGVGVLEGGGGGNCPTPVAMWITHNTDDMTVTLSYGTSLRDAWIANNHCMTTTTPVGTNPCVSYNGCSAGHPVVWCNPATGGHRPASFTYTELTTFFSSL